MTIHRYGKKIKKIKREELVVGDLIDITEGMRIPADCILTKINKVEANSNLALASSSFIHSES